MPCFDSHCAAMCTCIAGCASCHTFARFQVGALVILNALVILCCSCRSPSGDVRSVRVRTVECVDPFGSPVSPTLCVGPAPAYTQPCVSGGGELDVCPLGVPRNSVTGACCAETTGSSSVSYDRFLCLSGRPFAFAIEMDTVPVYGVSRCQCNRIPVYRSLRSYC